MIRAGERRCGATRAKETEASGKAGQSRQADANRAYIGGATNRSAGSSFREKYEVTAAGGSKGKSPATAATRDSTDFTTSMSALLISVPRVRIEGQGEGATACIHSILICLSLLIASLQDIRERSVLDLVWIPAIVGIAYVVIVEYPSLELLVVKVALVGAVALAFTYFGAVGQADAIALTVIAADPNPASPILPLVGTAIVAAAHIGYQYAVGNARGTKTIPIQKFLKEQRWIPKAIISDGVRTEVSNDVNVARDEVTAKSSESSMVEVTYGVPTVAYIGIGYTAYLLYLVIFATHIFLSLP